MTGRGGEAGRFIFAVEGKNVEAARWTVGQWRKYAKEYLEQREDIDAEWDADWMLCEVLGCGRSELRWIKDRPVAADAAERPTETP